MMMSSRGICRKFSSNLSFGSKNSGIRMISSVPFSISNHYYNRRRVSNTNNSFIDSISSSYSSAYSITGHQRRLIVTDNSWAADLLVKQGEALEKGPVLEEVYITKELYETPSDKVKKLSDEILSLNVVEFNQLVVRVQVIFFFSPSPAWVFFASSTSFYFI